MADIRKLVRNNEALAGALPFDRYFGVGTVVRICACGQSEALKTIDLGIREGYLLRSPAARLSVRLNPSKVRK